MRLWITFICLMLVVLRCPAFGEERPYLAVLQNVCGEGPWKKFRPDLYKEARNWEDFERFLEEVSLKAGNREIILDLDIHGNDEGWIVIRKEKFSTKSDVSFASTGYVFNRIDEVLGRRVKLVLLESCYSRVAIERTFRTPKFFENTREAPYKGTKPEYPIYGIGRTIGIDNLVFLQYRTNLRVSFEDLRNSIDKKPEPPIHNKSREDFLRAVCAILESYAI